MATVNNSSNEFAIEASADAVLTQLSSEFADIVLDIAARQTTNRSRSGIPLVDVCDIKHAAGTLCAVIRQGIAKGEISPDAKHALQSLQSFCDVVARECEG